MYNTKNLQATNLLATNSSVPGQGRSGGVPDGGSISLRTLLVLALPPLDPGVSPVGAIVFDVAVNFSGVCRWGRRRALRGAGQLGAGAGSRRGGEAAG